MKTQKIYGMDASRIALGAMRYADKGVKHVTELIESASELGYNLFDHADIYGGGEAESVFGEALAKSSVKREDLILQTKCGINQGIYNFDPEYIVQQTEQSMKRLRTDYLDILLLHRPDTLMEPEGVGEVFARLKKEGKVRHFGVSNFNPLQIDMLQAHADEKLAVNQVQISLEHSLIFDEELNFNLRTAEGTNSSGYLLSYARLNGMTLQAWSPLQYGFIEGDFIRNPQHKELADKLEELAKKYDATPAAIALAWLLRHPANIQPILGSTSVQHITEAVRAQEIELTRREWYELYLAGGKRLP